MKTLWLKETKNNAAKLLAETDWYVVRKSETSTAIPTDVATRRAAIRTLQPKETQSMQQQILLLRYIHNWF